MRLLERHILLGAKSKTAKNGIYFSHNYDLRAPQDDSTLFSIIEVIAKLFFLITNYRKKLGKNTGSLLVEQFISIFLITLVLGGIIKTFLISSKAAKKIELASEERYIALTLAQQLRKIAAGINSHRFSPAYRVHKSGKITYTDNFTNQISLSSNNRPAIDSDAITTADLQFNNLLRVEKQFKINNSYSLTACLIFPEQKFHNDEFQSFAALSVDGIFEMTGKLYETQKDCFKGTLIYTKSMLFDSLNYPLTLIFVVPLTSLYTVYVSDKNELRYLGHRGIDNIENQPVVRGIKELFFNEKHLKGAIPVFSVNFKYFSGKPEQITTPIELGRKFLPEILWALL